MQKLTYLFALLLFVFVACEKEDTLDIHDTETGLPVCLDEQIQTAAVVEAVIFNAIVKAQVVDGETHYWLNTGANAFDGDEFIVNAQCDTVCVQAGWIPRECISAYDPEAWEIVWEL